MSRPSLPSRSEGRYSCQTPYWTNSQSLTVLAFLKVHRIKTHLKSLLRNAGTLTTSPFSSTLNPGFDTPLSRPSLWSGLSADCVGDSTSTKGVVGNLDGPATAFRLVVIFGQKTRSGSFGAVLAFSVVGGASWTGSSGKEYARWLDSLVLLEECRAGWVAPYCSSRL